MMNVVITGSNQGIGYFLVKQLLKDGNKVDVRNQDVLNYAITSVITKFLVIDVAIHNACKCTME